MKRFAKIAAALAVATAAASITTVQAAEWTLDSSHSQIVFSYNHLGFSTTTGMFSGFTGDISFDPENPEAASVSVEIPTESLITGWPDRDKHFLTADFFDKDAAPLITFKSTSVEVTGDNTANITGDLTLNSVTKPVVLETTFNGSKEHPMMKKPWAGFDATAKIVRSEFDMGNFAPFISDEVDIKISVEAMPAE
ncbi:YceI family protein [Ahrensia kielensis]|uniref:YceI family protein n=1 Tax=Ahrensia kielensis TaxID=76980 RepID=A0ABU9T882_9HYPH